MRIFINYRREDSQSITGRIDDHLRHEFGEDQIFLDVDSIPLGVDFIAHIQDVLSQCDVCLAVIGRKWVSKRLFDRDDFVRLELEEVLRRQIPAIPILVEGAMLPTRGEVPNTLWGLLTRNALTLDSGRDFSSHIRRLIQGIKDVREKSSELKRANGPLVPAADQASEPLTLKDQHGFHTSENVAHLVRAHSKDRVGAPFLLFRARPEIMEFESMETPWKCAS